MNQIMYLISKASGEIEEFNENKLHRSLQRAGARGNLSEQIIAQVKRTKPKSTGQLHRLVSELLATTERPIASRYNLKRALLELGPAGYSFERYVAELFKFEGYTTHLDQIVQGKCVEHEVDIIVENEKIRRMVECKFHNAPGLKSDLKVALYVHARFLDLTFLRATQGANNPQAHLPFDEAWLVTNTTFTSRAEQYAACENLQLLSWKNGPVKSLPRMIDDSGLHPITILMGLSRRQKREFIKHGFVLCKDVDKHRGLLHQFGLSDAAINDLVKEAHAVCTLATED
jgi:hypothetical protein